jgi:Skp family chaperone for outer membrane proteins
MKHVGFGLLIVALGVLTCLPALAQPRGGLQIAVLNMPQIYREFPEVEKSTAFLRSQKDKLQKDLDDGTKELMALMKEIQDDKGKTPEEELKKKQQQWRRMKFDLDLKFQQSRDKLQKAEKTEFDQIKTKIDAAVAQVVQARKFDLVFEKQWLYYGDATDITSEVLAILLKKAPGGSE